MQYSLLLITPERSQRELGDEAIADGRAAFDTYAKSLDSAGVLVSAVIHSPSIATTTVSVRDGETVISGKRRSDDDEQLMGTFVIEVADREAAIAWAAKCPAAGWGVVEVRPSAVVFTNGSWHLAAS